LDTLTLAFALHLIILGYTLGFDFVVDQRTFLKARSFWRGRPMARWGPAAAAGGCKG
jgi:hypothetical protein